MRMPAHGRSPTGEPFYKRQPRYATLGLVACEAQSAFAPSPSPYREGGGSDCCCTGPFGVNCTGCPP
jgi:hypothetical protein